MADPITSAGLSNLDEINDIVQRKKYSDRRLRNEAIRTGQADVSSFADNSQQQLQQAQQPSEFLGATRHEYDPTTADTSLIGALGGVTQQSGGKNYYYGNFDLNKASWGTQDSDDTDLGKGTYNIMSNGTNLGVGYKSLADTIRDYQRGNYSMSPSTQWRQTGIPNQFQTGTTTTYNPFDQDNAYVTSPIYDYNALANAGYSQKNGQWGQDVNGYTVNGNDFFDTQDAAKQAIEQYAGSNVTGNNTLDWERLGQILNYGSMNGNFGASHSLGGNNTDESIIGLQTLFGSKPIIYDGKLYGYNVPTVDPVTRNWNDVSTSSGGGLFNKKTTTSWDVGSAGVGRLYNDPSWWANYYTPNGFTVNANDSASSPGWINKDYYSNTQGSQTKKSLGLGSFSGKIMKILDPGGWYAHGGDDYFNAVDEKGLYSAIFSNMGPDHKGLDNLLDNLDPGHNWTQDQIVKLTGANSQEEAFNKIAPIATAFFAPYGVGNYVNAANNGNQSGDAGKLAAGLAAAYLSNNVNTGYGKYADAAAGGAITGGTNAALQNKGGKDIASAALLGALSRMTGTGVGDATSGLGSGWSGLLAGASSGAMNSALDPKHMLESAITSGAAGGLGGMFNNGVTDKQQLANNKQSANSIVKLASLFAKRK